MSTLTALARARAVSRGIAQPVATVRHVHVSDRPLVLIPLALAGEANAPLAVMTGDEPDSPQLLTVSQPRNRDQRFAFAARLANVVLEYVDGYRRAEETAASRLGGGLGESRTDAQHVGECRAVAAQVDECRTDAPQIIVPNPAGIGFVRLLGRSTRFRRPSGEHAVDPAVPVLGRWLTFFAERAEEPGSCLLLAATQALTLHWASGQSPVEDLNLAALLGWVDPPDGMTGPDAALAAEDPLVWPPAGPATDPTFDNEVLAGLIAACGRRDADVGPRQRAEFSLVTALTGQLSPTWRLVWHAVELLRALPPGGRVAARWESDQEAFRGYCDYLRDGGPPQPRRDSAVAAARRLNWLERAQASYAAQRALDDPLVMADYRLTGEAFGGGVIAAEPDRLDASGKRRKLRPLVTVLTQDRLRVEPGTSLISPSRPGQTATVVSVTTQPPVPRADLSAVPLVELRAGPNADPSADSPADPLTEVVLELSGGMGRALTPAPGSVPEVGERLCYTTLTDSYQLRGSFPAREDTPWTHGGPPPEYVPIDADATEEWS
jgi:hypothetical protein